MTHQCWTQLSPSLVGALPGRSPLMCDLLCNKTWLAYIYIYYAKVWSSGTVARLFQKVWIMNIGLVLVLAYAVSYCSQISTRSSCCQLQTTAETMLFSERVWALFTLCKMLKKVPITSWISFQIFFRNINIRSLYFGGIYDSSAGLRLPPLGWYIWGPIVQWWCLTNDYKMRCVL